MRKVEKKQTGVTLLELMVVLAIIGILAAVSVPMYTDYSDNARISAMNDNMTSIILFEEEVRLDSGSYIGGEYDPADPDAAAGLKTVIGWDPRDSSGDVTYVVSDTSSRGFKITAQDASDAVLHTRTHCRNGRTADDSCR